ncbi:MAG: hypothetical protein MRZ53_06925, partial [Oscillospiraceae bacterium]|nr:hypothetical protein [Oscillospiraceae bacterium]
SKTPDLCRCTKIQLDICELLQKTCAASRPTGDARGEAPSLFVKALPRNSDGTIAQSDFSSDNTKIRRL